MPRPEGPSGGTEYNEYEVVPTPPPYYIERPMPTGPCEQTGNVSQQGPMYSFMSTYSTCTLTVLGRGRILVNRTVNINTEAKIYDRVWGFIVKSHNISNSGPVRDFEIKIVYVPEEFPSLKAVAKTTKIIWNPDSPSVRPDTRTVKPAFINWVEEQGLDIIDDQY